MTRRLIDSLSAELVTESALEMPIRLFRLICLVVAVLTLFVILPVNWFQNLPVLINTGAVLLGLFALFCFRESTRGRHHRFLFLSFTLLLLEPIWFLNSGADGSITLYFVVAIAYPMVIFRGTTRWAWTALLIFNICALLAIDYFFPSLATPFRSRSDRVLDLITGAFCSCVGLAMIVWVVISNYDRERERTQKYARDLESQHDNLSGLIESVGSAIFSVDRNLNYLSFNKAHASLMRARFNTEVQIGGNLLEYNTTREYRDKSRQNIEKALSGQKVLVTEQITVGDAERTYEIAFNPICNSASEVIGAVVYSRDVTERRAAEIALRDSEERMRLFVEHAPAALAMFDRQMRYLSVSRRWLSDYGLEGREIIGKSHYEVFPEIPESWRAVHRRALAGAVVRAEDDPFPRRDGSIQWLCWEVRPWRDAGGQVAGIVVFTEDVTYRRMAEQALADTHRRLAATVAAIPDLLFELDANGRIREYHAPATASLYAPPEAFLGKTIEQVLPADAADTVLNAVERATREGSHRGAIYTLDMPGGRRWYELSIAVKPGGSAPDARLVALVRDITERKQAEEETQVLRQELALFSRVATVGEFTASIAHDLNQPLAAILGNAEAGLCLIEGDSPGLGELREIFRDIVADGRRAADLIRSVRSMLKRDAGDRQPLPLDELIADVLAITKNEALSRNIAIVLDLDTSIPAILGQRIQIQQVILHLIINAFDAMEGSQKPGKIVIRTRKSDREVLLDVVDFGSGIASDKLDDVFKPLFTTKKNGLGIGLPLSRTIVNAHGGRLWVENNAEKGATFHVALPITGTRAPVCRKLDPEKQPQRLAGSSVPKIRVLLADDDPAVLRRAADLFGNESDIEIIGAANDGRAAVELAASLHPDVIVMDIDMPKLNGIEATQAITRDYPEIHIIGMSMHETSEQRTQAMLDAGATKYLTKNCRPTELFNAVRECASGREDQGGNERGPAA